VKPRRPVAVAAAILLACLCVPLSARAAFTPIQLVSKTPREQAAFAGDPVISADGRYVAFCARLGGHDGIFREQLETDLVVPVAVGPPSFSGCAQVSESFATAPSISAEGRYVSFTTTASLVHEDTEAGSSDVYVADMSTSPPTYALVSAADGSDQPLPGGSTAAGRVALSADGSRVAFVNRGNVYVREPATRRTVLISARRDPLTGMTEGPVIGGGAYEAAGAAISADGSTVAWVGEHLPEQVPLLGDEEAAIQAIEAKSASGGDRENEYHEPLWRRVPSVGLPPTRRIVGGGDPTAPGCLPSGSIEEPQCQGPYPDVAFHRVAFALAEEVGYGWGLKLPQLDADGDTVALVGDPDERYDLFVVDMEEGLDRDQAAHQVTQWTDPVPQEPNLESVFREEKYFPFTGPVGECAISSDGTRVAFTTTRQRFATQPYTLVTELPSAISLLNELYEVNLESDGIERVTPGPGQDVSRFKNGPSAENGAASPSFGADDRLIAFQSGAENLVTGDANERADVFTVEVTPPTATGKDAVSSPPPQTSLPAAWRMTANAYSRPDGSIRLVARVPGRGTLRTAARSQLGTRLKTRRVASARRRSSGPRVLMAELKLGRGREALARGPGLVARIHLTFAGPGGRPLHADLESRFLVHRKGRHRPNHQKGTGR
jgi:WD40-like Beta Propeller Repeat